MARFFISAAHKSSGKTVVSTGLAAALSQSQDVRTFKKGPDYIDPMWLSAASGNPCYNLDFNTMPEAELLALYASRAGGDISLIEANKGLYDGVSLDGADSNAALAKLLKAPVVLVIDTVGTTRGIAPLLVGYQAFDPEVNIAGVILNKVGGPRHESKLRAAVEAYTDIPVIGAIGKHTELEIGERHLGLTTPEETGAFKATIARIGEIVGGSVELETLRAIAATAPALPAVSPQAAPLGAMVKIGIARDTAFGFYYADDLEALEAAGAELVFFNTLTDAKLPEVDGLFVGGGFPETQMAKLETNASLRADIKTKIEAGLPTYAECGGLMYLCETLSWHGETHQMVGVVKGDAVMNARPQGRGYTRMNALGGMWEAGAEVLAHEFHYARVDNLPDDTKFAYEVLRGHGIDGKNDGVLAYNMLAGFCHLRNSEATPWGSRFVDFVRRKQFEKNR
ncbi:MAG: cobyrinate a,c-diamide synthase [Rhodobacteraceae bacterium]|nr:cobyrinate a,c-diamide synthase [Paracoccaceae bacterium]